MSQHITVMILATLLVGMTFLNAHHSRLLGRSWKREKQANDAIDDLIKAHANHARALQERIDILEGALRERGVNI